MPASVLKFTEANFQMEVLQSTQPVLVDFTAAWCPPCKMLAPTIDEIAVEYAGRVRVGKLDADESPNNLQNFPELLSAIGDGTNITVLGKLNGRPNQKFVIDVYATAAADPSGHGQGKVYLGSVTVMTNAAGLASFSLVVPQLASVGWAISATATRLCTGDTSEFSKIILLS